MKTIILDTNFLLIPGELNVDIFAELERICYFQYKLVVIEQTVEELETLAQGKGKAAQHAKIALDLINLKKVEIIKTEKGHVDDIIMDLADKDTLVATQDQGLKKRLKEKSIVRVILRKKSHLVLEGL